MNTTSNGEFCHTYEISDIAEYFNKKTSNSDGDEAIFYEIDSSVNTPQAPIRLLGLTIALCIEGVGEITIGLKKYEIRKNSLILLNPNQYVYSTRMKTPFKMAIIGCNVNLIQSIVPKLSGLLSLMIHNPMESVTDLTSEQASNIHECMRYIGRKLNSPFTRIKGMKIRSLLQALLCEIIEIHFIESEGVEKLQTRREEIFAKFVAEVMQNFKKERSVSFYANQLCVTPKHLSAVVKEISKHTAGELIDHYVIMEAKVMLAESSLTIQEIANQLNFANQSFFGKYFKHLTGYSPTNFRKMTSL